VHPSLIPLDAPLAKVDGVFNAVQVEGDLTGMVFLQGRGAGSMPTTSAVVADLLNIAHGIAQGAPERFAWREDPAGVITPMEEVRTRYYVRLRVADRAGVLAQITRVLGESHGISIASIIQKEANEHDQTAELVIMTHEAREADVRAALGEVGRLEAVTEIGTFLRVEGG
jgi:homoserine dehydrogenase